jgi:hypothetical protein
LDCKVFVETSVLVSASVYYSSQELGVSLIHHFYDVSKNLLDCLREKIKQKVGVTTITVEHEATSVLLKAIGDTIKEELEKRPTERDSLFGVFSVICDVCSDNLDNNFGILVREPIPNEEKRHLMIEVSKMYDELGRKVSMLTSDDYAKTMLSAYGPKRMRKTLYGIYKEQYEIAMKQITRLRDKPVDPTDIEILAEAVYLKRSYGKHVRLLMASTDYHFAPVKLPGNKESRVISDEIKERFGVVCEYPDRIVKEIKKK